MECWIGVCGVGWGISKETPGPYTSCVVYNIPHMFPMFPHAFPPVTCVSLHCFHVSLDSLTRLGLEGFLHSSFKGCH